MFFFALNSYSHDQITTIHGNPTIFIIIDSIPVDLIDSFCVIFCFYYSYHCGFRSKARWLREGVLFYVAYI